MIPNRNIGDKKRVLWFRILRNHNEIFIIINNIV